MEIATSPGLPFALEDAIAHLARTPPALIELVRGLPPSWAAANEGTDTWSPADVVAHLVHTERTNWMPRIRLILQHGEDRAFDEFDRFGHLTRPLGSLGGLLAEFATLRDASLRELRGLTAVDLDRRGRHPELGTVTLRQLLATWVVHDLDHIVQIARVIARQYTGHVGPWRQYLRVVRDTPA